MKKSLGGRLRELRAELSQCEFARKIGVKQTTYSSWERGIKEPSYDTLGNITRQFGVSADWLLGLTDDRSGRSSSSADPALSQRIAELEHEVEVLEAENSGLKYALDAIGKGASSNIKYTISAAAS